jgi:DNA polymerase-3 subunit gamma/tau
MSYQVLARKWRPRSFATLVGQDHVVRALSHALETGRLHHAWLFTGTRGVGKTTISRILAKALNCETGMTAEPCGVCDACRAIDADRFPDYVEMDAASNRGVDDMAALLDRAVYAPVQGRYKVYMIDEVHMLTGHAFNAMLKTLEEPPEHVKFILATTDPQKIPVTVLSRCLQFNLKQMSQGAIVDHLSYILGEETVEFERLALSHIARAAGGSMRDALSLLDQAISHGAGKVEEEGVSRMLGTVGDDHLYGVLDGLIAGDVKAMLAVADAVEMRSLSFDSALQSLASLLSRIALSQFAPGAIADDAERARIAPYAEALDAEYLQLAYQIAIHGRDELALAPDEYTGFTMTLLRLHAFRPEQPSALGGAAPAAGGGAGRAQAMPARAATPAPAVRPAAAASASAPAPQARPVASDRPPEARPAPAPRAAESPPWEDVPPAMPDDHPVSAQEMYDQAPAAVLAQAPVATDSAGEVSAALAAADWNALQRALGPSGMLRELCLHCEWAGFADDTLTLRLANTHHHLLEMNAGATTRLSELLSERAGRTLRARIEIGAIENETPAQLHEAERRAKHAAAVEALESDPFVCEVIERFDARFVEESVKPL